MIDIREIDETIEKLKREGCTIQAAERLAMLYIARDYMESDGKGDEESGYSQAAKPKKEKHQRARTRRSSAFLEACDGARIDEILEIVDVHMEAIAVLYPKEYELVVLKLRELE